MSTQDPEALRGLSAEELIAALDAEEAEQAKWWVPDYEKRDALKAEVLRAALVPTVDVPGVQVPPGHAVVAEVRRHQRTSPLSEKSTSRFS